MMQGAAGMNKLRYLTTLFKVRNTRLPYDEPHVQYFRFLSSRMPKEAQFCPGFKTKFMFIKQLSASANPVIQSPSYAGGHVGSSYSGGTRATSAAIEDLRIASKEGKLSEAMELFRNVQKQGIPMDSISYVCILQCCADLKALEEGREVYDHIIRSGFRPDVLVDNKIIEMYGKCGCVQEARQVFDKMPERDCASWNYMIAGLSYSGLADEAIQLFGQMKEAVIALKSLAQKWSTDLKTSNSKTWKTPWDLTGDPCTGRAIDSTDIRDSSMNPAFKCGCTFNNGNTCHIVQMKAYAIDITGQIPPELAKLTQLWDL